MGGYIFDLKRNKLDVNEDSFNKRNQVVSFSHSNSSFSFKKYQKLLLDSDPFIYKKDENMIIGNGTISYKGMPFDMGFEQLASDLIHKKLDKKNLFGHFTIIQVDLNNNIIHFYFDEAGYGAPFVIDNSFISSSFLSCIDNLNELELDKESIFETIYTGCYFNGKTTFKEIRKITKNEIWETNRFKIKFSQVEQSIPKERLRSREEAQTSVINDLNSYFKKWKPQIEELSADLGLSSGYDSRMMLCFLEKNYKKKYQVHTYWKQKKDFDNQIAEELAKKVDLPLIRIPIKDRDGLTDIEFDEMLQDAMNYYDGLFPVNHGWVREYRTSKHRSKILQNTRFGFSGLSGEQYRNDFNLLNRKITINYLINNLVLEDKNHEILKSTLYAKKGFEIIKESIIKSLDLEIKSNRVSRSVVQRYYCEMWVPGGPGIRNRVENNLTFFLSPFTERYHQKRSYSLLKYLGFGGNFQAEIINRLNPSLASIMSDYGFSFDNIKIKNKLFWFVSAIIGRNNKLNIVDKFSHRRQNYLDSFANHKSLIKDKLTYLKKFNFEFPIESPKFKADTIDRLIALSTLLKKYEIKIKI